MTESMVGRVARSISRRFQDECFALAICQEDLESLARAAIEAMREPTDKMQKAGLTWSGDVCWKVMIDAALGD